MKQNKLFIFLFVCFVLFSCSNDDNGDIAKTPTAKAKLSIAVKTGGAVQAKASDDPNALEGERNINRLTALVFDETGTELIGYQSDEITSTDGTAEIKGVETRTQKVQVVVIANAPAHAFSEVENLSDLQNTLADLQIQKQTDLTMSTQLIHSENILEEGDNFIGFEEETNINNLNTPITLTRIAARIDVVSISTKFEGTKLQGHSVRIDGMYLINAKAASHYFTLEKDDWGAVETEGHLAYGAGAMGSNQHDITGVEVPYLAKASDRVITDISPWNNVWSMYTFENLKDTNHTAFLLKATLLNTAGKDSKVGYFSAVINPDGKILGYNHDYIRRNFVYRLEILFTANSFDGKDEFDGDLTVNIKVLPWNSLYINSELQ